MSIPPAVCRHSSGTPARSPSSSPLARSARPPTSWGSVATPSLKESSIVHLNFWSAYLFVCSLKCAHVLYCEQAYEDCWRLRGSRRARRPRNTPLSCAASTLYGTNECPMTVTWTAKIYLIRPNIPITNTVTVTKTDHQTWRNLWISQSCFSSVTEDFDIKGPFQMLFLFILAVPYIN